MRCRFSSWPFAMKVTISYSGEWCFYAAECRVVPAMLAKIFLHTQVYCIQSTESLAVKETSLTIRVACWVLISDQSLSFTLGTSCRLRMFHLSLILWRALNLAPERAWEDFVRVMWLTANISTKRTYIHLIWLHFRCILKIIAQLQLMKASSVPSSWMVMITREYEPRHTHPVIF